MIKAWLHSRVPAPPDGLARRIETALPESAGSDPGGVAERLTEAALTILTHLGHDETRQPESAGQSGRVSQAALDLLAADALVTYAAEAAADECQSFAATTDAMIARLAGIRVKVPG